MSTIETRLRERCRANICALYPAWKQSNIALDGTDAEKQAFIAWRDENKKHMQILLKQTQAGYDIDLDADWPNADTWQAPAYMPKADGENGPKEFEIEKLPDEIKAELERASVPHGQEQDWLRKKHQEVTQLMFTDPYGDGRYHRLQEQMQRAMYVRRQGAVEVLA